LTKQRHTISKHLAKHLRNAIKRYRASYDHIEKFSFRKKGSFSMPEATTPNFRSPLLYLPNKTLMAIAA